MWTYLFVLDCVYYIYARALVLNAGGLKGSKKWDVRNRSKKFYRDEGRVNFLSGGRHTMVKKKNCGIILK